MSETLTAKRFADLMRINYRTALRWLKDGLVPNAVLRESPIGEYWEIPLAALNMQKPKRGKEGVSGRTD